MKFEIVDTGGHCTALVADLGAFTLVITDCAGNAPDAGDEFLCCLYAKADEGWTEPVLGWSGADFKLENFQC